MRKACAVFLCWHALTDNVVSTGREHVHEVSMQVLDSKRALPSSARQNSGLASVKAGVAALQDLGPAYDGFGSMLLKNGPLRGVRLLCGAVGAHLA